MAHCAISLPFCIYIHLNIIKKFYIDKLLLNIVSIIIGLYGFSENAIYQGKLRDFIAVLPFICSFVKIIASLIRDLTFCIYIHLNEFVMFYVDKIY